MSVGVDSVVSTMLSSGGEVMVHEKARIASNLGVPSYESCQWFAAHRLIALPSHDLFTMMLRSWVVRKGEEAKIGRLTSILKNMELLAAAEAILRLGGSDTAITLSSSDQEPQASTSTHVVTPSINVFTPSTNVVTPSKSISFGVKQSSRDFVGRANELKKLNDFFLDQGHNCVVIYAIGGQGKTELCKKFVHDLTTSTSSPPVVVWLPGESVQEFTSRVSKLARRQSISTDDCGGKPLPLLRLLKKVAKHIKKQFPTQRWLVVVDNVDEEYPDLENIIKLLIDFEAFVLITSRKNDILPGAPRTTSLRLETLSSTDAMLLVRNSLNNASTEDVISLCDKVGNHALALQQSVAFIRMQSQTSIWGKAYGISHFLQEFQDCQKIILQHPVKLVDYNHTIHAIVRTALDSISTKYGNMGQVALELGIILGLTTPYGVHLNIIQKLHCMCKENTTKPIQPSTSAFPKDAREAVLLLAKYSMLSLNDEVVSIHRLVQMVLRIECEYEPTINILLKHIEPEDCSIEELRQLISIWEHADHETVKTYCNFAYKIFKRMDDLSLVLDLSGFAEKNHTLLSNLLGPNHEETLNMEYCASLAMHQKGDYETALTKLITLQEKMKGVIGEEHPATLNTADLISIVLWCLNRPEEALEWKEKELECRAKICGENHMNTITSRSNKALILIKLGRMHEALSILQQELEWREVKLGSSHPHTLTTRQNIASIRFRQEQFHEARSQFEALLQLSVNVLGEEHVDTLNRKSCLAKTLWELRRRDDAMKMMEEVLFSQKKGFGPNHPNTNLTKKTISAWKVWKEYESVDTPSLEVNYLIFHAMKNLHYTFTSKYQNMTDGKECKDAGDELEIILPFT